MRFFLVLTGFLALMLPTAADAARIPIPRVIEQHLDFVTETTIPNGDRPALSLCHYYETQTVFGIGLWMTSNGYVLSDSGCQGAAYFDEPVTIARAFDEGQVPAGVPQTAAFAPLDMVQGYALAIIGAMLLAVKLLVSILRAPFKRRASAADHDMPVEMAVEEQPKPRKSARRRRKTRRDERMEVLGLTDGPVFRFIDVMVHAAAASRRQSASTVEFIRDKATDIAELEYEDDHIEWAIKNADRMKSKKDFKVFGDMMTPEQRLMQLRAALAVLAPDGRMSQPERRFVSTLSSALELPGDAIERILTDPGGDALAAA